MNILEKLMGNDYPKFETAIYADGITTIVTVSCILSPTHVNLEQTINVTVEVDGKFNSINDLNHLAFIAKGISEIAEDRLSEPEVIKNIGLDCKPFICTDEPEETQADA